MKKVYPVIFLILFWCQPLLAQPTIVNSRVYGGSKEDVILSMDTSANGNIVLALVTASVNHDVNCNKDSTQGDYWLICVNKTDNILWQQCYGGSSSDIPYDIHMTKDHGFIVIGETFSNDGDVKGFHGDEDFWVIKIDSTGNLQWSKCYGGSGQDIGRSIKPTSDGGYIMTGSTNSSDGDVPFHNGSTITADFLVIKIDSVGNKQWSKVLGGTGYDYPFSVIEARPQKYLVIGQTNSSDGDLLNNEEYGSDDIWLIMLDKGGNTIWQKCYGGTASDIGRDLISTYDGNIACVGWTNSKNGMVTQNYGGTDYWIIKIDTLGNLLWQKALGGAGQELSRKIIQTPDSGLIALGYSYDSGGTGLVANNYGDEDYWIAATDEQGNYKWSNNFGSSLSDECYTGICFRNRLYFAGEAQAADHDVTRHYGNQFDLDGWLIELEMPTGISEAKKNQSVILVYPNPAGDMVTFDFKNEEVTDKNFLLDLFAVTGKCVLNKSIMESKQQIDVSGLHAGIYFYHVTDKFKNMVGNGKLVVVRD